MLADRVRMSNFKTNGGMWVSANNSSIYASNDGINWEKTADINSGISGGSSLVYVNNLWVVAQGNCILTSTNGIDWEIQDTNLDGTIIALAYGNGVWVGVDDYSNKMHISTDLISWESYYASGIYDVSDIDYDNGIFTIIGRNRYATSNDGISWQRAELSGAPNLSIVKHLGNDMWFLGGGLITSDDYARYFTKTELESGSSGSNWSTSYPPLSISSNGEGVYVIGCYRTSYLRRTEQGIGGYLSNISIGGGSASVFDIEYANEMFVLVGSSGTSSALAKYSTDDGLTWNDVIGLPNDMRCIKYGGD